MTVYDERFYDTIRPGARASAAVIVPDIMRMIDPGYRLEVIDVGAGSGEWSAAFTRHGAHVLAVDGEWGRPAWEQANGENDALYVEVDLSDTRLDDNIYYGDLAVCLEVAEHLDESRADGLVADLCRSAVVLFSAAVPGQPGHNHVNCQPPTYWRDKFGALGYTGSGALRYRYWGNPEVEWWYQENLLIFWRSGSQPVGIEPDECHYLVHPVLYDSFRLAAR